jgi:hypothetical protein
MLVPLLEIVYKKETPEGLYINTFYTIKSYT